MAAAEGGGDKYRSFLHGDGEKNTVWRTGRSPSQLRPGEQALRGREDQRMARVISGRQGAALAQDLGDGDGPQGAPRGPEERRPLRGLLGEHQRAEASDAEGADGHRRLRQRVPGDHPAAGAPHLRPRRGVGPVGHGHVPHGVPPGLRHRGARRVQRPAQDRLQVPALGLHGGRLQGAPPTRAARRVLWRLHLSC